MPTQHRNRPIPVELIDAQASLDDLRNVAQLCQGCDIWRHATQVVFGEGPAAAKVMFVGEQPGNREDRDGHPFVGPAGKLLDEALMIAGIERERVYVTNIVKHFKSTARGKFRIHKRPNSDEISACRPWLDAEIERVVPKVIVCLGATAAKALISPDYRVSHARGGMLKSTFASLITATVHPSSILRSSDKGSRDEAFNEFVMDLKTIAQHLPTSALSSKT
jgi:uracil-DNA glycosylase family protein